MRIVARQDISADLQNFEVGFSVIVVIVLIDGTNEVVKVGARHAEFDFRSSKVADDSRVNL